MRDSQIEERLRSVLRDEGDRLPQTITTAELDRRLAARRRQARGRRLSLVAAAVAVVAVVVIGALGNGWLRPAIGSQASPSPSGEASPSASLGLGPIVRATDGRLVYEIPPTASGAGGSQAIHGDVAADDYVVSVKIQCIGRGSVTFTDRANTDETACTDTTALDPAFQPVPIRVPTVDGAFDTTLTVGPGITYAMLVETVPLPDHIPLLTVPDGAIGMSSTSVRPNTSDTQNSVSTASGRMDGPTEWVQMVCLGPGVLSAALGPVDHSVPATTVEAVCDGLPSQAEISIDFSGDQVLDVTTDDRLAWQLVATRTGGPLAEPVGRGRLGKPSQAILVRPIGDPVMPTSLEVSLFDPDTFSSRLLATVPGSFLPTGDTVEGAPPPIASATGWLAIPIQHPDAAGGAPSSAIVVVDLRDPTAPGVVLEGYRSGAWDDADELAVIGDGPPSVFDPESRIATPVPLTDTVELGLGPHTGSPIWSATPGSRFLALGTSGPSNTWGAVDAGGVFTPTNDLPAAVQRSGLERVTGVNGHTLTIGCDAGATAAGGGCAFIEKDVNDKTVATRANGKDTAGLYDYAWSADGKTAWLLLDGGTDQDGHAIALDRSTAGGREEVGRLDVPSETRPQIVGIGPETSPDGVGSVVVADQAGYVLGFVRDDSSGVIVPDPSTWFAGWAGLQPAYDPD